MVLIEPCADTCSKKCVGVPMGNEREGVLLTTIFIILQPLFV